MASGRKSVKAKINMRRENLCNKAQQWRYGNATVSRLLRYDSWPLTKRWLYSPGTCCSGLLLVVRST